VQKKNQNDCHQNISWSPGIPKCFPVPLAGFGTRIWKGSAEGKGSRKEGKA